MDKTVSCNTGKQTAQLILRRVAALEPPSNALTFPGISNSQDYQY